MNLGNLKKRLENLPEDMEVENGFGAPDSYRGYYKDVAFEPVTNTTIGEMLYQVNEAIGSKFIGYKGGEFWMDETVDCYIANYGELGAEITPYLINLLIKGENK